MLKKMATMAAALSLVAGGVAPAVAAHPLSLANIAGARGSADLGPSSRLNTDDDSMTMQLIGLGAVALIVLGIVLLLDDDVEFTQNFPVKPTSP